MYIADSIYYKNEDKFISLRYADIINKNKNVDKRTSDEVAIDIINKCGLVVK